MKKLKIILQHNITYYVFLFIVLISYFINTNIEPESVYKSFNQEKFIINDIVYKDYGVKLILEGKEKVLGMYYTENKNDFKNTFFLGDHILITGEISNITHNTVPNTFDYKKYLISNKIYNVVNIKDIKKVSDNKNILYKIKYVLIKRGEQLNKSSPYINSLIFGNNNYIDEEVMESYRNNGVSHLFAISGLHISIFVVIISLFIDKLKINKVIKYLILILFLIFYMFITNFSMSVLRGAIFTILLFINKLLKLDISTKNILFLTLIIILLYNPLYLNNIGLQYSFIVTLFLITFSNLLKKNKLYNLFMISLIAFLASYPITINNFYQINLLSVFYNLFFVPFVSILLIPTTLISYIFPILDSFLYILITIIERTSRFLEHIDTTTLFMCKIPLSIIVLYYVGIFTFLKLYKKCKIVLYIFIVLFITINYYAPFTKIDYILFFDIGQGDSTLINVNNKTTLIDTGGLVMYSDKEYTYKLSKNKLLPYFKSTGIKQIDNMVLSHGDADHMKEAYFITKNFGVRQVYMNSNEMNSEEKKLYNLCKRKNIKVNLLTQNEIIDIGGYKLKSLNHNREDENDSSIVLYGKIKNTKVLFTGDISKDVENSIINEYNIENIDILKVAHHGSNTSSSKQFIDKVNSKYSVISVGYNNRFGHPNEETLNTLQSSKIYRTDEDGSIIFKIKRKKLKIETCSS